MRRLRRASVEELETVLKDAQIGKDLRILRWSWSLKPFRELRSAARIHAAQETTATRPPGKVRSRTQSDAPALPKLEAELPTGPLTQKKTGVANERSVAELENHDF